MPSSHLILCHPLLLLPPIPPSIRVFSNESALHMRWLKYWSFSFSISPSNEHPELISFRMDCSSLIWLLPLLASLKVICSCKVLVLFFFWTSPSLTPFPYTVHGVAKSRIRLSNWTELNKNLFFFKLMYRRQWHPTPVLLPGKSHRRRTLVGCSPWDR